MLFEILHFDWFGIAPIEIARLSIEVADRKFGKEKTSIRQLLAEKIHKPPPDLFSEPISTPLKQAGLML